MAIFFCFHTKGVKHDYDILHSTKVNEVYEVPSAIDDIVDAGIVK